MIEIDNVSKSYGSFQVLKNCSASIADGEVVVICGPSGSGKSTLIKTVNGLETIDSGEINVSGFRLAPDVTNVAALRRSVGMVFQSFELFPHLTVLSNVTIAQIKVLKRSRAAAEEKARMLLARVGLSGHITKYPAQLSGGQQQRVAIARALVTRPEVVFADEPTGALDTRTGRGVLALLRDIVDQDRRTVVMVTHDPVAAAYADHVIVLADGRVAATLEAPTADDVAEQLAHLGG